VIGEELGFAGAMALLALLGLLLWRGLRIAAVARDPFGALLAAGVVTMLAFQAFVNIGMTIGIMPITGIPLPLVSYGGSSLVATFLAVGLLENVHMRRHLLDGSLPDLVGSGRLFGSLAPCHPAVRPGGVHAASCCSRGISWYPATTAEYRGLPGEEVPVRVRGRPIGG
jgi:hypothetical protein